MELFIICTQSAVVKFVPQVGMCQQMQTGLLWLPIWVVIVQQVVNLKNQVLPTGMILILERPMKVVFQLSQGECDSMHSGILVPMEVCGHIPGVKMALKSADS